MSRYVPPSKRAAEKQEITQLGTENFPAFGTSQPKKAALNFLQQVKEGEEARNRKERERVSYDPAKIALLTKEQLETEGWAVLSLNVKEGLAQWNTPVEPEVKEMHPEAPQYEEYDEDYEEDYEEDMESQYESE